MLARFTKSKKVDSHSVGGPAIVAVFLPDRPTARGRSLATSLAHFIVPPPELRAAGSTERITLTVWCGEDKRGAPRLVVVTERPDSTVVRATPTRNDGRETQNAAAQPRHGA